MFLAHKTPSVIGITGGIGSGKSLACSFIEEAGYPVYYSDDEAKNIVNNDAVLKSQIISLLGQEAYNDDGYNRSYVRRSVGDSPELLPKLDEIIHPAVAGHFKKWVEDQHTCMVFKETALLFELGLYQNCASHILITAEIELRKQRVMKRPGMTEEFFVQILQKQWTDAEKAALADHIIPNNNSPKELKNALVKVLQILEQQFCADSAKTSAQTLGFFP